MSVRTLLMAGTIGLALSAGGTRSLGQPGDAPPPPPLPPVAGEPSDGPDGGPNRPGGAAREEARQRVRRAMAERLAQMKRDQADVERVITMMDEGKTIEQIREALGTAASPRLMDLLRGRTREGGPRGAGMGVGEGDGRRGPGGGADADLLGEVPGATPGRRPGGPEGGPRGEGAESGPADGPPEGPGRRGGGGRPGRDEGPMELTDEDRAAIREFVAATAPGMAKMFAELEKRDPEAAEKRLREVAPRFRDLLDLRKRDRRLYDLRMIDVREGREALEAAREIVRLDGEGVETSDARHAAATARLRGAIAKQIDARGEAVEHELKKMQERIADGQADLAERGKKKDRLVDEAVARMLQRERGRKAGAGGERRDEPGDGPGDGRGDRPPPPGR